MGTSTWHDAGSQVIEPSCEAAKLMVHTEYKSYETSMRSPQHHWNVLSQHKTGITSGEHKTYLLCFNISHLAVHLHLFCRFISISQPTQGPANQGSPGGPGNDLPPAGCAVPLMVDAGHPPPETAKELTSFNMIWWRNPFSQTGATTGHLWRICFFFQFRVGAKELGDIKLLNCVLSFVGEPLCRLGRGEER